MVYPRWSLLYHELEQVRDSLQASYFDHQREIETRALNLLKTDRDSAIKLLTDYGDQVGNHMVARWREMAYHMIVKYNDGVVREEDENGNYKRNSSGYRPRLSRPGMSPKARHQIHKSTGTRYEVPPTDHLDTSYM